MFRRFVMHDLFATSLVVSWQLMSIIIDGYCDVSPYRDWYVRVKYLTR